MILHILTGGKFTQKMIIYLLLCFVLTSAAYIILQDSDWREVTAIILVFMASDALHVASEESDRLDKEKNHECS